ncbi:N-acetyl sugar amidotransferase [Dongia mobilis]|jgi:N-acetyl sugar amidotransferase|uniref:N-acetyl sugar amidotransferase n=1 Tax=Dongia sp. TaxID=1977262 RepID=UPI0026E9AC0C
MRYCKLCLYPETKPDLSFDEHGVCNACLNYQYRAEVDWDRRKDEFLSVIEQYRSKNGDNYDCLVPVSGGKDSTYQLLRLLEVGMNPLCVTATTDDLSDIGRRNIENIKKLGVDYIEVTTNPVVRRRINRFTLETVGDISWPEHVTIFTVPVRVAVQHNIRLIVWGENPQHEYGGPAASTLKNVLDRRWLEEFGGLLGLRVSDIIGQIGVSRHDMIQYTYPSDEELARVGVTGIFLGYYFPWDGYRNALYAQGYGFETFPTMVEGALANYENLDNHQMGLHDYFKFLKYGFGRATDIACNHIRRGRLTRRDGLELVKRHDGKFPWTYLGKKIEDILAPLDMPVQEFVEICDRWTNKKLFKCDNQGKLLKDRFGNLQKLHIDNG